MAWIDDRVWCHPKVVSLSDRAFRVWVSGIAYSSGMGTRGVLEPGHQKLLGATPKIRTEIIGARLWDVVADDGTVAVHDWDAHNGKRDDKRAQARERKRRQRDRERDEARDKVRDISVTERVTSRARGRRPDDGSEGSEGSEGSDVSASEEENRSSEAAPLAEIETAQNQFVPPTAQTLTAEFVDACRLHGIECPRRLVGQIAQQTGQLVDEGITADAIRGGYRRMIQRGIVQPSLLPNFVAEDSIPNGLRSNGRGGITAEEVLADAHRLEQEGL